MISISSSSDIWTVIIILNFYFTLIKAERWNENTREFYKAIMGAAYGVRRVHIYIYKKKRPLPK